MTNHDELRARAKSYLDDSLELDSISLDYRGLQVIRDLLSALPQTGGDLAMSKELGQVISAGCQRLGKTPEQMAALLHWTMIHLNESALPQTGAVPEGWKLVPVEATPDMEKAFKSGHYLHLRDGSSFGKRYEALLAAAQPPPKVEQGQSGDHVVVRVADLEALIQEMRNLNPNYCGWKTEAITREFADMLSAIIKGNV